MQLTKSKIFVAGHHGMVGSAVVRKLESMECTSIVTRKITRAATRIKLGLQEKLFLGSLDARRDWGYSKDYVEGMWKMLQHHEPDDFALATGATYSIRDFLDFVGEHLEWDWKPHVEIDPRYFRPTEVKLLLGDCSKAKEKLGWEASTSCRELAQLMVDHDLNMAMNEAVHSSLNPS